MTKTSKNNIEVVSPDLEIAWDDRLFTEINSVEPVSDDELRLAGVTVTDRLGSDWDIQRQGGARWAVRWDDNGMGGPCLRMLCRDFALIGKASILNLRLGGRLFSCAGGTVMTANEPVWGSESFAFVLEYALVRNPQQSLHQLGLDSKLAALVDFDGALRSMSFKESWELSSLTMPDTKLASLTPKRM